MNILSEALAILEKWPQVENHRYKVFTPKRPPGWKPPV